MGEAKRRRAISMPTIYHHTSTLRTNLIWMSGVIDVEGNKKNVFHPQLGEVGTAALMRRSMRDFPPVAWFTRRIDIPNVLIVPALYFEDKKTGNVRRIEVGTEIAHGMSLHRVALGFPLTDIDVTPWPEYRGYRTLEGQELNITAREAGDNPDEWYVSEMPVEVMKVSEFWASRSILLPKLQRSEKYVAEIKRMVTLCRERRGVYISPTWFKPEQAAEMGRRHGVNVMNS